MTGCGRKIGPYDCCTVVCGDCREMMKAIPDGAVDAVITDPPYGIGRIYTKEYDDSPSRYWEWFKPAIVQCRRLARVVAHTHRSSLVAKNLEGWDWIAAWHKPMSMSSRIGNSPILPHWEPIFLYVIYSLGTKRDAFPDVISVNPEVSPRKRVKTNGCSMRDTVESEPDDTQHPLPKPLHLMEKLVRFLSLEGETVFDPFLGSGTTAVAAKKFGRHFLGFEISPEYCKLAEERIALVEMQPTLFAKKPEQGELSI